MERQDEEPRLAVPYRLLPAGREARSRVNGNADQLPSALVVGSVTTLGGTRWRVELQDGRQLKVPAARLGEMVRV